ncbi:Pectinesterase A [Paramyrothecium foliicola]|nr:Pectinesterase A [Paramyrothecium foliicola]
MRLPSLVSALIGLCSFTGAVPAEARELVKKEARTSPPSGCLSVGTGGTHKNITDALNALGSGTSTSKACIFIYAGTYASSAQVYINYKGALTLYGYTTNTGSQGSNAVTFTRNINSATAGSLDASSTFNIVSANFKAYNINFKNLYGKGAQAVAVTANGDKQGYYACGFYGYQDTLYAKNGKQYYSNCYIEGAVDYIFGNAAAWFGECTIASNGDGYITASSRSSAEDPNWYVFDSSQVKAVSGYSGVVYLGRPWRDYACVMYQNTELTNVVREDGWQCSNNLPEFREFQNTGPRANSSKRTCLKTPTNSKVTKETLWGGDWKSWVDTTW